MNEQPLPGQVILLLAVQVVKLCQFHPQQRKKMITMADEPKQYTTGRGKPMDLHHALDNISAGKEDAIIHDQNRSFSDNVNVPRSDAKGDYYEVFMDGKLYNITETAAEAEQSAKEYRRNHPKQ